MDEYVPLLFENHLCATEISGVDSDSDSSSSPEDLQHDVDPESILFD